jgi:NADPH:quinone reductase-like Zn-dependent oxidoreductase
MAVHEGHGRPDDHPHERPQASGVPERMMVASRIHAFGGRDEVRIEAVKVLAASVNPVDFKIRQGKYPEVQANALPYTLGRDACGEVAELGEDVTGFSVGEPVFAMLGIERGGHAEYAIVLAEEAVASPRTDTRIAGAVPLAGMTAWQGLFRYGELQAGQRVLIHGGAGGVGHFAIQFARARGAFVVTTVSHADIDFARSLGADQIIDYKAQRFEEETGDIDVVLDLVAGETQTRSWTVLKEGGILVSTLTQPPADQAKAHKARGTRFTVRVDRNDLGEIARLIDAGEVKPRVSKSFALDDAASAYDFIENGHTRGKIVLEC